MAALDQRVTAGVGVIAMRNDEEFIVLHRCAEKHGKDTWSLPGGKPDPGESPHEAAIRELREETGAIILPEKLQTIQFWNYTRFPEYNVHTVTLYFIGDIENPDEVYNVEPEKHDELRWVAWETLPQPYWPGLDQLALIFG